jgi:hypothetical protein
VGIRVGFCKYNRTTEKCTLVNAETNFLRPFYSFMDKGVTGKVLVSCMNTIHVCIVIYHEFSFFFVTPVCLLVSSTTAAV